MKEKDVSIKNGNRFRVVRLEARNIRRLKAIDISPPANGAVIVAGGNGHGKTSLLDSIMLALAGGKSEYEKAIRRGEDQAEIILNMGSFIAHRVIRPGKPPSLTLTTAEGHVIKKQDGLTPREFLDGIIGNLSFDPLGFTRLHPRDRVAMLMRLVGLSDQLAAIDAERAKLYDQRTGVSGALRDAVGELRSIERPGENAPTAAVAIQPLLSEKNKRQAQLDVNNAKRREVVAEAENVTALAAKRERLAAELQALDTEIADRAERLRVDRAHADSLVDPNLTEIDSQIVHAQITNDQFARVQRYQGAVARVEEREKDAAGLTAAIKSCDDAKRELLAAAEFPIPGLSFDGADVLYNDIHFSELSSAETLRVSLAMAMAMNPSLRVIRITDGSLLDDDNMAVVCEMASKRDYQVWIECVGDRKDAAVVIEDGAVKQKAVAHA